MPTSKQIFPRQFSLRDLLVTITVIGLFLAILPVFLSQRVSSRRRLQCMNNMRQVGLATIGYVTSRGSYPGYQQLLNRYAPLWAPNARVPTSWTVLLFPQIEQEDLYNLWNAPNLTRPAPTVPDLTPQIPILICPTARPRNTSSPINSYVANAGFLPRTGIDPSPYGDKTDANFDGIADAFSAAQTTAKWDLSRLDS